MYTTIQITREEDNEIAWLKRQLQLPSKRAVLQAGLESLRQIVKSRMRTAQLKAASLRVRRGSRVINHEWAQGSTALDAE